MSNSQHLILLIGGTGLLLLGGILVALIILRRNSMARWRQRVYELAALNTHEDSPQTERRRLYQFVQIAERILDADPRLADRVRINVTMDNSLKVIFDRAPSRRTRRRYRRAVWRAVEEFAELVHADADRQPASES